MLPDPISPRMDAPVSGRLSTQTIVARVVLLQGLLLAGLSLTAWLRQYLPGTPVPLTLQTFFVFLAAMTLGARRSMPVVLGYLALGACGLPMFTSGAGLQALFGPNAFTAGFLFGFLPAAWVVGTWISRSDRAQAGRDAGVLALGFAVLFVCGGVWFKMVSGLGWAAVWGQAIAPFVLADAAKIAAAYGLHRATRHRVNRFLAS